MTYNVKTGGYDGPRATRLDAIAEVVAAQAPDVLALQELRGASGEWLADRLGMRMVRARSAWGQPVAVLVGPEWTVLDAGSVARPFHHAAARVAVSTLGGPLTVVSAHLHPHWGWRRLHEARWLVSAVRGARLALVMGDLNTLDPWTDHTERLRRLPPPYRLRHLRWRPLHRPAPDDAVPPSAGPGRGGSVGGGPEAAGLAGGGSDGRGSGAAGLAGGGSGGRGSGAAGLAGGGSGGRGSGAAGAGDGGRWVSGGGSREVGRVARVDTRAVAALDAAGLVDVFRAAGAGRVETAPTALGGPEFSGMRLDYLFASPALAAYVRSCRVVESPDADRASDHYPVVADIDL